MSENKNVNKINNVDDKADAKVETKVEAKVENAANASTTANTANAAKPKVRKSKKVVQSKSIVVKSKRKEAVARVYIKKGSGKLSINKVDINALKSKIQKAFLLEPIQISTAAANYAKALDIKVNVKGGGVSAQMQAARSAIAKGIVSFSNDESLKKTYLNYDRNILIDDPRRVEPKKFKGPKARARFQTSYR
ncbi:MAG: 30S ribosomal protein S9 [Candidatus Micrarchaeia archaeon]